MKRIWNCITFYGFIALVLGLMMVEYFKGASVPSCLPQDFHNLRNEAIRLILVKTVQKAIVSILFSYHIVLLWLNASQRNQDFKVQQQWWRALNIYDYCKFFLALCAVWHYVAAWNTNPNSSNIARFLFGTDQSTNVLVFLAGIVLSQFVEIAAPRNIKDRLSFARATLIGIVTLLTFGSLIHNHWAHQFKYRGEIRMTGLWNNPNTFGLLMSVALILALTFFTEVIDVEEQNRSARFRDKEDSLQNCMRECWKLRLSSLISIVVGCAVVLLLARGLIFSYSRGAWLATLVGCAFVFSYNFGSSRKTLTSRLKIKIAAGLIWIQRQKRILVIAACSAIVLMSTSHAFMDYRWTNRITSVANMNDFSWQNRLIAYKGALQILADHPIIGVGWYRASGGMDWHRAGPEFNSLYAPPILTESWSIILNDYLTIGMALGIPALICFFTLIWIPLGGTGQAHTNLKCPNKESDQTTKQHHLNLWLRRGYRNALVVFGIAFWFDGGLFKLATASVFWIVVELGREDFYCAGADAHGFSVSAGFCWHQKRLLQK